MRDSAGASVGEVNKHLPMEIGSGVTIYLCEYSEPEHAIIYHLSTGSQQAYGNYETYREVLTAEMLPRMQKNKYLGSLSAMRMNLCYLIWSPDRSQHVHFDLNTREIRDAQRRGG